MTLAETIAEIEAHGIECRRQSTYFGDEVCVHLYGNNERAAIYGVPAFLAWAAAFLASERSSVSAASGTHPE